MKRKKESGNRRYPVYLHINNLHYTAVMNKRTFQTVVFLKFPECVSFTLLRAGSKESLEAVSLHLRWFAGR